MKQGENKIIENASNKHQDKQSFIKINSNEAELRVAPAQEKIKR